MANICSFLMKVKGNHDNVNAFYNALVQDGGIYIGRGADAEIEFNGDVATISGGCKWSIWSALVDNAISMRTQPECWYFGESVKASDLEFITLVEASQKWNLIIEVYSEESGCCFQEHYFIDNGVLLTDESVEWNEFFLDDYSTKEEAEAELEIEISDLEWEECRATSGGFGDWIFDEIFSA